MHRYLPVCLSICLSVVYLFNIAWLSVCLSTCISFFLSGCLYVLMSDCLSVWLLCFVCWSVCISHFYLTFIMSVSLFICNAVPGGSHVLCFSYSNLRRGSPSPLFLGFCLLLHLFQPKKKLLIRKCKNYFKNNCINLKVAKFFSRLLLFLLKSS